MSTQISATQVKQLREMSDAPMMDCKKALVECGGDLEKSLEYLRQKGLSKAIKKADRLASEGVVALEVNEAQATMLEINSETDFVAKNDHFKALVSKSLEVAKSSNAQSVEELYQASMGGEKFQDYLHSAVAKIGENIVVRRLAQVSAQKQEALHAYLHANQRVGAIIKIAHKDPKNTPALRELARQIAMHAAAMKPVVLDHHAFSPEFIAQEKLALVAELEKENEEFKRLGKPLKHIPKFVSMAELTPAVLQAQEEEFKAQLKTEGKPEKIFDKILPGKMERFIADNTLLDQRLTLLGQFFVMDDKKTIAQVLQEKGAQLHDDLVIGAYVRFEVGEGVEKKSGDFAAEVAAQMQG
ncbi:translation elongation factor Ts [Helicobacter mehlei]|uniref:Elongation factor Ts n=1 Tax=Helicobacter mehlei TaxID=2316080 RepID=A0A553V3Q4_9HELI|nr:translation elongation factor Ts [Helicobacter mehlei]TSA87014.1 elongation factor Ts [Helicobacter mehlei]